MKTPGSKIESVLWNCPQNLSEEEKAQARANIGAASESGGGGDSNLVIMHLENVLGELGSVEPVPAQSDTQIWSDMADVILDGKVLVLTMGIVDGMGAYAMCNTFFDLPPEYTREQFKELLSEDEEYGTLEFMFDLSLYGGLINVGVKVLVSPVSGVVPYYLYMTDGPMAAGISLDIDTMDKDSDALVIFGSVYGFLYNAADDTYSPTFSYLPKILVDLQNQGKTIAVTGYNKDMSYAFVLAPVKVYLETYGARGDFMLELNTLCQYDVDDDHYGEERPVLWRGVFRFMDAPEGFPIDGYYVVAHDKTYVMDFTLIDNDGGSDDGSVGDY